MQRRNFIKVGLIASSGLIINSCSLQNKGKQYFYVEKRKGRWWFINDRGKIFWSIGLNHVDSASLRYNDSAGLWDTKYNNSMREWLHEVKKDLIGWNFNTMGWNQEVVTINEQNHRHSRSFTYEEYQWLDMPYCHMLPFIESHQWEIETRLPDIKSKGFKEWCEYVARDQCARLKNDPKLIGYFFSDCPAFVHFNDKNKWKAPLFDPELLKSESGKKELFSLATIYYRVLHDAIRLFDTNHLILGDRYESNAILPDEIIKAALPYVDVFSFQCFGGAEAVKNKLGYWAGLTKRPVLLADSSLFVQPHDPFFPPHETCHQDGRGYTEIVNVLKEIPEAVGFHLCGAYIENKVRKYGLKNNKDQIDSPYTENIAGANLEMQKWIASKQ